MAQALVRFLANQYVERDGMEQRFFAGCFGIFGHGNVAGVGQALQQYADAMPYFQARNEQAMVHAASAYARQKNRLQILACTSSIGPGATNMVTGAALATITRLPVLLLPGDIFATRDPDPVLQQLEAAVLVRGASRPMIVSGGGTIYSEATEALKTFAERTGIPFVKTQAGKGSMPYDHPLALGAVGATGTFAANRT